MQFKSQVPGDTGLLSRAHGAGCDRCAACTSPARSDGLLLTVPQHLACPSARPRGGAVTPAMAQRTWQRRTCRARHTPDHSTGVSDGGREPPGATEGRVRLHPSTVISTQAWASLSKGNYYSQMRPAVLLSSCVYFCDCGKIGGCCVTAVNPLKKLRLAGLFVKLQ